MFSQLLFFSLLPLTLAGSRLRVVHRVYLPLGGPVPFAERGTLHITDDGLSAEFTPSKTIGQDLQHFANVLHDISPDGALYQVGLERGGDMSFWDISSVKACHLPGSTADSLVFQVTHEGHPYSFDYFVAPIPHDGACPKESPSPPVFPVFENTTVYLRYPSLPPLPELRTPPPLSPEGAPIEPVPEKSFVQKYWVYGIGLLLAVALVATPPEEEAGSGGGRK